MRRHIALAVLTIALLAAGLVGPAPPAGAVDRADRSDWGRICNRTRYRAPGPLGYEPYEAGANCREMRVDGIWRRFIAYVPESVAQSNEPAPVVLFLHGTSGTGEQHYKISRWVEVADRDGLIAVFPTAAEYRLRESPRRLTTRWNDYGHTCDIVPRQDLHSDVDFVDRVLVNVAQSEQADPHRVYAAGFSSGGTMVNRLALDRPNVFAAVGAHAGNLRECPNVQAPVAPEVPVFFSVGSLDDRFLKNGLPNIPPHAGFIEAYFGANLDLTTEAHALERNTWQEVDFATWNGWTPANPLWPSAQWTLLEWSTPLAGNTTGNSYVLGVIQDVPHHYPNAWPLVSTAHQDSQSAYVAMADVHWTFFQQHVNP